MCVDSVVKMRPTLRILAAQPGHDLINIIPTDAQFKVLAELLEPLLLIKTCSERMSAEKPSLHIVLLGLMNIMTMSREEDFTDKSSATQNFVLRFESEMLLARRFPDYGRKVIEVCVPLSKDDIQHSCYIKLCI